MFGYWHACTNLGLILWTYMHITASSSRSGMKLSMRNPAQLVGTLWCSFYTPKRMGRSKSKKKWSGGIRGYHLALWENWLTDDRSRWTTTWWPCISYRLLVTIIEMLSLLQYLKGFENQASWIISDHLYTPAEPPHRRLLLMEPPPPTSSALLVL